MTQNTAQSGLDLRLTHLDERKRRWARLPVAAKIAYLKQVRDLVVEQGDEWVRAGSRLKGFGPAHPSVGGEEWLGGPYPTAAWITDAIDTLTAVAAGKDPLADVPKTQRTDGQLVLRVMPASVYDRLLLSGYSLDVWMEPGVTADTVRAAAFYSEPSPAGGVTVVLGAGNASAIPVLDTLYALFVLGDVVALKLNPVSEVYGPVFEAVFAPLIADGYLDIFYGDGQVGADLVDSDLVTGVHITGSERTFDAIVWGDPAAKAAGTPRLTKPITSELGGVGATIVVPGQWTRADIEFQAEHVATQKLHSSGHTCVASQVLVLPAQWAQRDEFLAAVRVALRDAPAREPFYPGTRERLAQFAADNPDAEVLDANQRVVLLTGLDASSDHPAFRSEFFGPIYVTTDLPGNTVEEYLEAAVDFANNRLAGNLGVNMIIDPMTAQRHADAVDAAIADLRYGCIGVNAWSAVAFLTSRAAWGAFAGNDSLKIESGSGFVHNSLMLERPQKNVVRAPFRPFPRSAKHLGLTMAVKPPWFLQNATSAHTARQFTHFAAQPHPLRLPGLFASALRG